MQKFYSQAQIHIEMLVEHMFGIWKNCYHLPRRCCIVTIATAVLHNYLEQHGCLHPHTEDDDPHAPMAEAANDRNELAYMHTFALQHFLRCILSDA